MPDGVTVVRAVLGCKIDYSVLENDSASETHASMMLHCTVFPLLRDPEAVWSWCSYHRRMAGSPGTTFELLWRIKWCPALGDSDVQDTISSPKQTFAADPGNVGEQEVLNLLNIMPTLYTPTLTAVYMGQGRIQGRGHEGRGPPLSGKIKKKLNSKNKKIKNWTGPAKKNSGPNSQTFWVFDRGHLGILNWPRGQGSRGPS